MKRSTLLLAAALALPALPAAGSIPPGREVKNVILMISDGTSLSTLSLARWMQWYADSTRPKLNVDPYLCGTVRTSSSDAPIGDSAPTTSCYMTGQPSQTGFVATCPPSRPGADLFPVDTARAYRPALTLLEAARLRRGASTGLVVTCEFPHATPADCSAHSYDRNRYDWIVPQMASGSIDVLIGGGTSLLSPEAEARHRLSSCWSDSWRISPRGRSSSVEAARSPIVEISAVAQSSTPSGSERARAASSRPKSAKRRRVSVSFKRRAQATQWAPDPASLVNPTKRAGGIRGSTLDVVRSAEETLTRSMAAPRSSSERIVS